MNTEEKLKYLQFVENQANANARYGVDVAESLLKDAGTLLNILIAGIGGSIAITVQFLQNHGTIRLTLLFGLIALYLMMIATVLVTKCIKTRYIYPPASEPKNLLPENYEQFNLEDALHGSLLAMQSMMEKNRVENTKIAVWLDGCRFALLATPIVFILGWFFLFFLC